MTNARRPALLVGVAILAIIGWLMVHNCLQLRRGWQELGPLTPGGQAPDFSLPTVAGTNLRLSEQHARVLLLDFWAAWCRPCMRAMPSLATLQGELGNRGLQILSISVDGNADTARRVSQQLGPAIPILLDDGEVSQRFGVHVLPFLVLVESDRRIIEVIGGPISEEKLRAKLLRALASPPSHNPQSR